MSSPNVARTSPVSPPPHVWPLVLEVVVEKLLLF